MQHRGLLCMRIQPHRQGSSLPPFSLRIFEASTAVNDEPGECPEAMGVGVEVCGDERLVFVVLPALEGVVGSR